MYELNEIKKLASQEKKPKDFTVHESVIYHTFVYCYRTYKKTPTESTKNRLKAFSDKVVELHYGKS